MKFEKQTYTQTPNSLFVEMKDMDECELKVVMLICRYTFGYHRDEVKLSTRRIADEIGMNTASVQKGADKAIERGLIEKVIDGNKTTTWRALVSDSEVESPMIQKLNRGVSDNESLSRVKESNKEKKEKDFSLSTQDLQEVNEKVDYILSQTKDTWQGRELLRDNLLPLADWSNKATNQVMTKRVQKTWYKALQDWHDEGLTPEHLQIAFEAQSKWRMVSDPNQLTKDACAIKAAGTRTEEPTEPKFKDGSAYV